MCMNNSELPLIVLRGLEGNDPTQLGPVQSILAPHTDVLIEAWVVVLCVTLATVFVRHIVFPLWRKDV